MSANNDDDKDKNPTLTTVSINVWKHAFIWGAIFVLYFSLDEPYNEYQLILLSILYLLYLVISSLGGKKTVLSELLLKKEKTQTTKTAEKEVDTDHIQVDLIPISWIEASRIVISVMLLGAVFSGVAWLLRMQIQREPSSVIRTIDIRRRLRRGRS